VGASDADPDPEKRRIVRIDIDDPQRIRLSPTIEQERRIALYDLIEDNRFALVDGAPGPYGLHLAVEDGRRLRFRVHDQTDRVVGEFALPLASLQKIIRDYFLICDSYVSAIKTLSRSQIEAIDMGRRGLHNEGADLLADRLAAFATMDKDTARRLFTLICIMHIRG
jgi:uncharacterized protein (UPF0262 family)